MSCGPGLIGFVFEHYYIFRQYDPICTLLTQNVIIISATCRVDIANAKKKNVTIVTLLHLALYQRHPGPEPPSVTFICAGLVGRKKKIGLIL